jgi:hypothetical protein
MLILTAYLNGQSIGIWHTIGLEEAVKIVIAENAKGLGITCWVLLKNGKVTARFAGNTGYEV